MRLFMAQGLGANKPCIFTHEYHSALSQQPLSLLKYFSSDILCFLSGNLYLIESVISGRE